MKAPFSNISELQKTKLFKLLRTHIYNFNKNGTYTVRNSPSPSLEHTSLYWKMKWHFYL